MKLVIVLKQPIGKPHVIKFTFKSAKLLSDKITLVANELRSLYKEKNKIRLLVDAAYKRMDQDLDVTQLNGLVAEVDMLCTSRTKIVDKLNAITAIKSKCGRFEFDVRRALGYGFSLVPFDVYSLNEWFDLTEHE